MFPNVCYTKKIEAHYPCLQNPTWCGSCLIYFVVFNPSPVDTLTFFLLLRIITFSSYDNVFLYWNALFSCFLIQISAQNIYPDIGLISQSSIVRCCIINHPGLNGLKGIYLAHESIAHWIYAIPSWLDIVTYLLIS